MKRPRDVHVICDCQRHAIRERRLWRRAVRGIRRGGVALVLAIPLTFGAVGIPGEALEVVKAPLKNRFHIFTTPRVEREFLAPLPRTPRTLSLTLTPEVMREQFFHAEVPFGSIIYREAMRNNLAPELVAAVVEAESDFRPRLISGKNAQGLMQIIPSTGRLLGADDLFKPEANVAAGAKYLRYLFDRFENNQRVALAAYNAGEGNVERFGGVPPFPETLNYVQRVETRARQYRKRVQASYFLVSRVH
jgi:soluble lytic murein transglycosylase-like protein